jgi:alkylated DNA nucleotide flippase Atl1
VLLSTGQIASRGPGTLGARRQRRALEAEGVTVTQSPGDQVEGGGKVNWAEVGWFPDRVEHGLEGEGGEDENEGEE